MSFKRVKVVMLPTNEKANNKYSPDELLLCINTETKNVLKFGNNSAFDILGGYFKPQHLYFLSDEEIKEGDWFYYKHFGEDIIDQTKETTDLVNLNKPDRYFKKIIATTAIICTGYNKENSKTFNDYQYLPQPSQSFIEKYVEEYNKGNVITEVMVEYDYRVKSGTIDEHKKGLAGYEYFELKVNPKDNTITIRKVKDSFTKIDFMNALHKAEIIHGKDYSKIWKVIEENL